MVFAAVVTPWKEAVRKTSHVSNFRYQEARPTNDTCERAASKRPMLVCAGKLIRDFRCENKIGGQLFYCSRVLFFLHRTLRDSMKEVAALNVVSKERASEQPTFPDRLATPAGAGEGGCGNGGGQGGWRGRQSATGGDVAEAAAPPAVAPFTAAPVRPRKGCGLGRWPQSRRASFWASARRRRWQGGPKRRCTVDGNCW